MKIIGRGKVHRNFKRIIQDQVLLRRFSKVSALNIGRVRERRYLYIVQDDRGTGQEMDGRCGYEGSDLDDDEYCVICDEQLMFDYNEEASDFTKQPRQSDDVP
ncbi:unnamed protein product [Toxocara canis]|uniref:Polyprotein n=1 Tax=Toxocara canis TaxID=6265 RepID=A0A183V2K8_TOXCA|nr:unnamed protein product [Toxocara canis]